MIVFFFFFFNTNKIYESEIVREAFRQICAEKLLSDKYCDMEEFLLSRINKKEIQDELAKVGSLFVPLYKKPFPKLESAKTAWFEFEMMYWNEGGQEERMADYPGVPLLKKIEAKAIVNWIYQTYKTVEERTDVTEMVLDTLSEIYRVGGLAFKDTIIYVKSEVEINNISSFTGFCNVLKDLESPNRTIYYRGHSDSAYKLLPSIMREKNWLSHERDMYNELIIACSSDFKECKSHLDYLVHMQHYGLPTRLMDVTRNPLVALYFACESKDHKSGEVIVFEVDNSMIKYPGSDTVSILASLSKFKENEKDDFYKWAMDSSMSQSDFNKKAERLLHEVKLEKPAFRDEIKKEDICNAFFVLSEKKNKRIIKQDGAFITCGLFIEKDNPVHKYRYKRGKKKQIFIIKSSAKKRIREQLDKFTINKAFIYPDIDDVAEFIQTKYKP